MSRESRNFSVAPAQPTNQPRPRAATATTRRPRCLGGQGGVQCRGAADEIEEKRKASTVASHQFLIMAFLSASATDVNAWRGRASSLPRPRFFFLSFSFLKPRPAPIAESSNAPPASLALYMLPGVSLALPPALARVRSCLTVGREARHCGPEQGPMHG